MQWCISLAAQKLQAYLSDTETKAFYRAQIEAFMKYGFNKRKATVSTQETITCTSKHFLSNKRVYFAFFHIGYFITNCINSFNA
jgi:hypothetical protein